MKKRFTVTLDEDIVKEAKKKAIDENTNLSAMVEYLLMNYTKQDNARTTQAIAPTV